MTANSDYLKYLPPVLWEDSGEFSLGAMLRIFEKVLTGIDDGVELAHGDHAHGPLTDEVERRAGVFDPWATRPEFLPWLASLAGLDFPAPRGADLWDEYQRRKVVAEIAKLHRLRGRKLGLSRYLDLLGAGQARVALDDGTRLLAVSPRPGRGAVVTGMVTKGPVVVGREVRSEGVTRPWCLTTAPDGGLIVGDLGLPDGLAVQLKNRVWHLDAAGACDMAGAPPKPLPIAKTTLTLTRVVAVAVRKNPDTLYVLDRAGRLQAVPAPFRTGAATQLTSLISGGTTFAPVAMAVDAAGDLIVLDRGDGPGTPNPPKIITVRPSPLAVTRTPLRTVREPLSLAIEPDGTLLIGDGGVQEPENPAQFPGNLVKVDRRTPVWTETTLLPAANPLVAPTGLARTRDGSLYVLDAGLKPFSPSTTDPYICPVAEHAAVLRVDAAGRAERITEPGQFVYPTGMVADGDRLVVCDPGQPAGGWPAVDPRLLLSRVRPFQFDVVIHFAQPRLPPDQDARRLVLNRAVVTIRTIVDRQKPAHTVWNLVTSIFS
ncbi:Phage tail protein (Tail_P2_I) [Amycolatopsis xylanica]|uniref:Phage tail protein (Tail_P2_I) n=1 Tax=Amycolatopsis xylanica TaxID=589385 RepID=A0A1H2UAZ5_9PSEU|nr:phage tail protein [Amycolatopsis xylanica]SDW52634.1 Phage tail protein (Tail_P2_I) [Amycolatopsis xylanica]